MNSNLKGMTGQNVTYLTEIRRDIQTGKSTLGTGRCGVYNANLQVCKLFKSW